MGLSFIVAGTITQFQGGQTFLDLKLGQFIAHTGQVPDRSPFQPPELGLPFAEKSIGVDRPWLYGLIQWHLFRETGWAGIRVFQAMVWLLLAAAVATCIRRLSSIEPQPPDHIYQAILIWIGFVVSLFALMATVGDTNPTIGLTFALALILQLSLKGPFRWVMPGGVLLGILLAAFFPPVGFYSVWFAGIYLSLYFSGKVSAPNVLVCAGAVLIPPVLWATEFVPSMGWQWFPGEPNKFLYQSTLLGTLLFLLSQFRPAFWGFLIAGSIIGIYCGMIQATLVPAAFMAGHAFSKQTPNEPSSSRPKNLSLIPAAMFAPAALLFVFFAHPTLGFGPKPNPLAEQSAAILERTGKSGTVVADEKDAPYLVWRLWPNWTVIPLIDEPGWPTQRSLGEEAHRVQAIVIRDDSPWSEVLGRTLAPKSTEPQDTTGTLRQHRAVFLTDSGWLTLRDDMLANGNVRPFRRLNPGRTWDQQTTASLALTPQDWLELGADIRSLTLDQPDSPLVQDLLNKFRRDAPPETQIE
jgi:hypothetical protein